MWIHGAQTNHSSSHKNSGAVRRRNGKISAKIHEQTSPLSEHSNSVYIDSGACGQKAQAPGQETRLQTTEDWKNERGPELPELEREEDPERRGIVLKWIRGGKVKGLCDSHF